MSARGIDVRQFMLFLAGGVGCALIDVGIMWWLIRLSAPPLLAATAGFLAGLVINFAFHTRVTFANTLSFASFVRFMAVVVLNYLLTLATISLAMQLVHSAGADSALLGKIVALPLVALNGYWLSKHWIFK